MEDIDKTAEEEKLSAILLSINAGEFSASSFQTTLFELLETRKGKYVIEALIQAETDASAQTSDSSTTIGLTIEQMDISNAHKRIVQLLLNSAENRNFFDGKYKQTVLHFASKHGWLGIVQSLLKKGADPNVKDFYGDTPLMLATQSLRKDVAELLMESGADVLCHSNVNYTLLHAASEKGWLELVQSLLDKGVDPNAATKRGFTPLDFAIKGSNKDVVSLLVDSGANPKSCKLSRHKFLTFATEGGHLQVLQDLVEKAVPSYLLVFDLLNTACAYEQVETIEYLVKSLNKIIGGDETPLQFIINTFRPTSKLVQLFIERGAYFDHFEGVLRREALKVDILQNTQICTQAIINKFNNKYLPKIYKLPLSGKKLPPIESLSIKTEGVKRDIEQSVRSEIEANGHCNVLKPKVIVLRMMAVKSYIDYFDGLKNKFRPKRSADSDSDSDDSQSFSKRQCSVFFQCIA